MSPPLTENRGAEQLMLFVVDSHARTLVLQGTEKELKESEADSGKTWHEWFAKLDQNTYSWKIRQRLLFEDLEECLKIWPRYGMMRDGECFPLPMLEHDTRGNDSGSWPTPRKSLIAAKCTMATVGNIADPKGNLEEAIFAREENKSDPDFLRSGVNPDFEEWLMLWPIKWSALEPLEMGKFQAWLLSHGEY